MNAPSDRSRPDNSDRPNKAADTASEQSQRSSRPQSRQQPRMQPRMQPSQGGADARYGDTRGRGIRGKWIILGVVVILVVSGLYIANQMRNAGPRDASVSGAGFERHSDQRIDFFADVSRTDPSKPAYCVVTALDYDKNEVGRREFYVPPSDQKLQRFVVAIPTQTRAVAATPYGCSLTIPSYLDRS